MKVVYDLTIYEADRVTPMFGDAYDGDLEESDFQTPDPDLEHPRPYLSLPLNGIGSEVDFIGGSSKIGTVQVKVLDKRTDPADQTTGILTARVPDLPGRRAVLRRYVDGSWRIRWEGVVYSVTVDQDTLVHYVLELHDGRQFEKDQSLFFSNFVLYGRDGAQGPADDYGTLEGGGVMLAATEPYESIADAGIDHFERLSGADPRDGIHWGLVAGPYDLANPFNLADLGWAVFQGDGLMYFREFQVRWRPKGSDDDWITLRNMPSWTTQAAANRPGTGFNLEDGSTFVPRGSTLYLGSFDPDEIPETGQEIELQVMAVRITRDTPFWWDRGSLGDLLQEIADGEHTVDPPAERYDAAALAAYAASSPDARFIQREPVTDRRRWIEEHDYKAGLVAPTFNTDREIVPRSWEVPDPTQPIPRLQNARPIGEWSLPIAEAVREVEYTYIREHLEPRKTKIVKDSPPWWTFGFGDTREVVVDDPTDTRRDWERLVETEITITNIIEGAPLGGRRLVYRPTTIRSTGDVDGAPIGGDTQSELGQQLADKTFETILLHNATPRPRIQVSVVATPENLDLTEGDLVRALLPWLPDITSRDRDMRQIVRIKAVTESDDPSELVLTLEYTGVPDISPEDDETGTGMTGEDCLDGGTLQPAGAGIAVRVFRTAGRFTIENTCDHPVTCDLVAVAGGGGGGDLGTGGGGGAGGVLGGDGELEVVIPANSTVTVDIGDGGAPGDSGEDTIVWINRVTGDVMDPDVDDPDDAYRAIGGGHGGLNSNDGENGGSGGGGGALPPITGGADNNGGDGTAGQGNSGGMGQDTGGTATCRGSAGGGGGSYAGAGGAGVAGGPSEPPSEAGIGGPSSTVPGWGITLGGGGTGGAHDVPGGIGPSCNTQQTPGSAGASGWGYGGGGGADASGATGGGVGGVALRYEGPNAYLQAPTISSVEIDDEGRAEICIEGADWPAATPDDYKARIEYALAALEPDPDSSAWLYAGMLEAPGCVFTPPLPTGAKVWARARAQAPAFKPSQFSGAVDADAPETPGALSVSLTVTRDGVATLTWTPNAFSAAQKIRGLVHDADDSTARPLALIDGTVVPGDSPYTLPALVPEGSIATIDLEFWEDGTYAVQGRTERRSEQNPTRRIVTRDDGIDKLADVVLTDPQPGDALRLNEYGDWENVVPKLDDWAEPDDNTDLDATAARHGLLPKLSGSVADAFLGDGTWGTLPSGEWSYVVATTDQDVTNNGTPQDDTELFFPVTAGMYLIELLLLYSGSDASADYDQTFNWPGGELVGTRWGSRGTGDAVQDTSAFRETASGDFTTTLTAGTKAAHGQCVLRIWMLGYISGSGTFQYKFCNGSAAPGRVSRREAGSVLRYRKAGESAYPAGPHTHAAADITSGTFADALIAESNVTQHEAALSIAFGQLTFAGLTTGAVLRATGATTAAFGQLDLADGDAVTGLLPWANVNKAGSSLADLATRSASDLSSGVLADARVQQSNVTQHQAALAIAYGQLTFSGLTTGAVFRATGASSAAFGAVDLADTDAVTGSLPWANVDKTGSSLADLATRSAGDLSSGNLAYARLPTGGGTWANGGDLVITGGHVTVTHATMPRLILAAADAAAPGYPGANPQSNTGGGAAGAMQIHGILAADSVLQFGSWGNNTVGPGFAFAKSRGGAAGTFGIAQSGDVMGSIAFSGDDSTDINTIGARIQGVIAGAPGSSMMPGELRFSTALGAVANDITLRWTITSAGIWQSNGAQTIQSSTGALTIATAAGNGDVILSPHGSGKIDAQKLLLTLASAAGGAGFRIPQGAAPSSPVNGDMWATSAGLFIRIDGITEQVAFI